MLAMPEYLVCSAECQAADWETHGPACSPATSILEEFPAIAVPDYRCFWAYQNAACKDGPRDVINVCILSRVNFVEMFGEAAVQRTCLHMAVHGKPCKLFIMVTGKGNDQDVGRSR